MTAAHLEASLNLAWVLICAFLVMLMQVGFAMVETGFTRSKNAVNTMAMNFVIYPVGVLGFWLVGYGLMLGGVHDWPTLAVSSPGAAIGHEVAITVHRHVFGLFGASKFALNAFTSVLRMELSGSGISVSLVCPGYTKTEWESCLVQRRAYVARTFLHPMTAQRVAMEIAACVERPRRELLIPKVLILPVLIQGLLPGFYEWLQTTFRRPNGAGA